MRVGSLKSGKIRSSIVSFIFLALIPFGFCHSSLGELITDWSKTTDLLESPTRKSKKVSKLSRGADMQVIGFHRKDDTSDGTTWIHLKNDFSEGWIPFSGKESIIFRNYKLFSQDVSISNPTRLDGVHPDIFLFPGGFTSINSAELGASLRPQFGTWKRETEKRIILRFKMRVNLEDDCIAIEDERFGNEDTESNGITDESIRKECVREAIQTFGKSRVDLYVSVQINHTQGSLSLETSGGCDTNPKPKKERYCIPEIAVLSRPPLE